MAKNPNRLGRVNEELKKEISQIINYELNNSNITGMISVTRVRISPDLRYAKVYVSIFNSKNIKRTLEGLIKSEGFIRSRIASTINLRTTPELVFKLDDSEIQGERIDQILRELKEDNKGNKAENNS